MCLTYSLSFYFTIEADFRYSMSRVLISGAVVVFPRVFKKWQSSNDDDYGHAQPSTNVEWEIVATKTRLYIYIYIYTHIDINK